MIHTLDTIMSEYYQHVDVYKKMQHDVEDIINKHYCVFIPQIE